jgi:hypothetical protein
MNEIFSNHHLKITSTKENNIFNIELKRTNPILLLSLKKFIRGATCSDDYISLTFKAYSVEMLNKKMNKPNIQMAANMLSTLANQLHYLITEYSYTFLGYNTENIIVIDKNKYLFLDIDLMSEIDDQHNITIFYPFKKIDFFVSPELKKVSKLPCTIHYKTTYFSLGCLLLQCILSWDNTFYDEYLMGKNMDEVINKFLNSHPIKETKFYWLICRCLVEEPEKRSILFI